MQAITFYLPFFPIPFELLVLFIDILFGEFSNSHVCMEVFVWLALGQNLHNFPINLLQFFVFLCLRIQEHSSMRKVVHFAESYFKAFEVLEFLLQKIESFIENIWINKGKAYVDVRFPSFKCGIMDFSDGLNLLIVVLSDDG